MRVFLVNMATEIAGNDEATLAGGERTRKRLTGLGALDRHEALGVFTKLWMLR